MSSFPGTAIHFDHGEQCASCVRTAINCPPVLVGMDDNAEINAVHRGIPVSNSDLRGKVIGFLSQMSSLDCVQRALESIDYFGLRVGGFFSVFFEIWASWVP